MVPSRGTGYGEWGRLGLFFGANVLFGAGLFSHAFLYNFYLDGLGLGESTMGAAAAALTAGGLAALAPAGVIVDRAGPRRAYRMAALLAAAGLAAGAYTERPWTIYLAAFVAGAGASVWRVAMGPVLMRLASPGLRARAFSWNVALLVGSGAGWILVAGGLPGWLERTFALPAGAGLRWGLVLGAAGTAASAAVARALPAATPDPSRASPAGAGPDGRGPPRDSSTPLPRWLWLVLPFLLLWMAGSALVLPFFNVYFLREHGLEVERIGWLLGLGQALVAVMVLGGGLLASRAGPRRALLFWMVLFPPAIWALGAAEALGIATALYLLQAVIAPATNPLIDQILLEGVEADRQGVVSSWRNGATELAGLLGAGVGGLVLEGWSFAVLFGLAGLVAVTGSVGLAFALPHGKDARDA